jgi:hypothetical protein
LLAWPARDAAAEAAANGLPSFAEHRRRQVDADEKVEGNFATPVPLFGYDPNTGLGLGVGGYYNLNGRRDDPFFAYTPYRHRFFAQVYATTGGYQQHLVSYDGLYLRNSPYRIRATVQFEKNIAANYFGVGEATLRYLSFLGQPHHTYADQTAAASALRPDGVASPDYNHYQYVRPTASATLERDFLGGWLRAQYGVVVQHVAITRFDGTRIEAVGPGGHPTDAVEGPTKLGIDCAAKAIIGCDGGWNNLLKAGVVFDTRDYEPDPNSGVFVDATGEWSSKAIGSEFNYVRLTLAARVYVSPFPKLTDLVLAARVVYSMQTTTTPFFAMNTIALTEQDQSGLGGENSLRGFREARFVGPVEAFSNLEIRWTFVRFDVLKQHFSLQAAPFFDVGRVFDRIDFALASWKPCGGGGVHIGWNQSTIVRVDAGFSSEDWGLYIDFGMPF